MSCVPGTVRLQSSDGEVFVVKMAVARISRTLATMLDDLGHEPDDVIPLPNVTSRLMKKVLAWIDYHLSKDRNGGEATSSTQAAPPLQPRLQSRVPQRNQHTPSTITLTDWEREFVRKNKEEIYELLLVANYLDIKALLDLLCQTVAGGIKGKDPEVIRRAFNALPPHTPSQDTPQNTDTNRTGRETAV